MITRRSSTATLNRKSHPIGRGRPSPIRVGATPVVHRRVVPNAAGRRGHEACRAVNRVRQPRRPTRSPARHMPSGSRRRSPRRSTPVGPAGRPASVVWVAVSSVGILRSRATASRDAAATSCSESMPDVAWATTASSTPRRASCTAIARRARPRSRWRACANDSANAASSIRPTSVRRSNTRSPASGGTPFLTRARASSERVRGRASSIRRQMIRATVSGSPGASRIVALARQRRRGVSRHPRGRSTSAAARSRPGREAARSHRRRAERRRPASP